MQESCTIYIYCTYITNLLTQCIAGHSLIYIPSESEKLPGTHYLGKKSRKAKALQRVCFTVLANRVLISGSIIELLLNFEIPQAAYF